MISPPPLPPSLWAATAQPAPDTPPLQGERSADVAIVGGGYTGLSAALHAAEAGADVVVLEAAEVGWGASGRNAGQVNPSLRLDPDGIEAALGRDAGARLIAAFAQSADLVFDLIARHAIACDAVRAGWLQLAPNRARLSATEALCEQWRRRGAPVAMLDAAAVAGLTGSGAYLGGMLDSRCGAIQPLSYARGLARAALSRGAAVHAGSPATAVARAGERWRVATPTGAVVAETLILATNAYTGELWPGLKRTIIPVVNFQAATAPLGENVRRSVLPGGHVATVNRTVGFHAFRRDATGRFIIGGGAAFTQAERPGVYRALEEVAPRLFPQLEGARWQFRWSGAFALTPERMLHLHEPAPGVLMALGYNGRGIAPATLTGKLLAARALGAPQADLPVPFVPLRPLALHRLLPALMAALVRLHRLREAVER